MVLRSEKNTVHARKQWKKKGFAFKYEFSFTLVDNCMKKKNCVQEFKVSQVVRMNLLVFLWGRNRMVIYKLNSLCNLRLLGATKQTHVQVVKFLCMWYLLIQSDSMHSVHGAALVSYINEMLSLAACKCRKIHQSSVKNKRFVCVITPKDCTGKCYADETKRLMYVVVGRATRKRIR